MSASLLAWYAALTAAAAWAAKAVAIGLAGGLDRSALEGPLFLLGLLAALVGAGALGAALADGRGMPQRAAVVVVAVVAVTFLAAVTAAIFAALAPSDPGWVWSELNLWVIATLLVVAAAVVRRQPVPGREPAGA
jgi:hypothetical protein